MIGQSIPISDMCPQDSTSAPKILVQAYSLMLYSQLIGSGKNLNIHKMING